MLKKEMARTLLLTAMLALAWLSSGTAAYYEAPPDAQALSVADLGPLQALTDHQLSAVVAQEEDEAAHRVKRMGAGPSLSIVNPMDVLRQRLLLEIARRRLRDAEDQIQANRKLLASIGKRAVSDRSTPDIATEWDSSNPRWNDHFSTHQS